MGGLGKRLPWDHARLPDLLVAICGVPIFSGFFSKDCDSSTAPSPTEVHGPRSSPGRWGRWSSLLLAWAALGTAFYMSRLDFLVFSGECRAD